VQGEGPRGGGGREASEPDRGCGDRRRLAAVRGAGRLLGVARLLKPASHAFGWTGSLGDVLAYALVGVIEAATPGLFGGERDRGPRAAVSTSQVDV
jgi:hypothetical protein